MKWIYEKVDSAGIAIKTLNPEHAEWCIEYRDNVRLTGDIMCETSIIISPPPEIGAVYTIWFKDIDYFILFKMTFPHT